MFTSGHSRQDNYFETGQTGNYIKTYDGTFTLGHRTGRFEKVTLDQDTVDTIDERIRLGHSRWDCYISTQQTGNRQKITLTH